ncbi:MAG: hypothetical protein IPH62_19390 [Ignavibacteriae bacterium]|nr:hypothetical protein [Ignavibacteriota bacterium]
MTIETVITCDKCHNIIKLPQDGYAIIGNIGDCHPSLETSVALIGVTNFEKDNGIIKCNNVKVVHYCKICLLKDLNITFTNIR